MISLQFFRYIIFQMKMNPIYYRMSSERLYEKEVDDIHTIAKGMDKNYPISL